MTAGCHTLAFSIVQWGIGNAVCTICLPTFKWPAIKRGHVDQVFSLLVRQAMEKVIEKRRELFLEKAYDKVNKVKL